MRTPDARFDGPYRPGPRRLGTADGGGRGRAPRPATAGPGPAAGGPDGRPSRAGAHVRPRRPRADPGRARRGAAARPGLHGAPGLGAGVRGALEDPSGDRLRPALARPWHPLAPVQVHRLRRRRRRGDGRARGGAGRHRRLLDGWRDRPAGLAPAPRQGRRAGALLDGSQLPRPQAGEVLLPGADGGDPGAGRARLLAGRAAGRLPARGPVAGPVRGGLLGSLGVPEHQRVVVPRGAGRARTLQLRELDRRGRRADGRRGHRARPHDPATQAAQARRLDRARPASTRRREDTPRSCSAPAAGCRASARRWRT